VRAHLLWTLLAALLTAGVLWWLLTEEVIAALGEALAQAGVGRLTAAAALVPAIQWLRAWRFELLLSGEARLPSGAMFQVTARLLLFNFILPFKLGELSFPLLMKRAFGTGYIRAAGILVLARLMDLCVVAAILMIGTALVFERPAFGWGRPALLAGGLIALVLPVLAVRVPGLLRWPTARLPRVAVLLERLNVGMARVRPLSRSLAAQGVSAAIWLTHSALAWLAASAVAPALPVLPVVLAGAASNVAFALPVNGIAGLGPPQAAWATVLDWAGASWEVAAITALVCHGTILIGVAVTGALSVLVPVGPRHGTASSRGTFPSPES
jgi:Lysylphosphatidylglycerol synthase TM region